MKMVKSLLLGSAAGLVAIAGAQAADLPVKAKPVQYVKICSLYGVGFYYIPGTDMCIKVGGWTRAQVAYAPGGNTTTDILNGSANTRATNNFGVTARGYITADARNQTAYGTVRAYIAVGLSNGSLAGVNAGNFGAANAFSANRAFLQWAGFTFGLSQSFYDFYSTAATAYWGDYPASDTGDPGWHVFAYTAQFGNGLSATISAEDARRSQIIATDATGVAPTIGGAVVPGAFPAGTTATTGLILFGQGAYGGAQAPDVVGNLRVDQAWGSAQVMAAWHDVNPGYYGAGTLTAVSAHPSDKSGFAIAGGLKLNAPMIGQGDYLQTQVNYTEGATRYAFRNPNNNWGARNGQNLTFGVLSDGVYAGTASAPASQTGLQLTTAWSVDAAYEHFWNAQWRTSVYGGYGEVDYNSTANGILCGIYGGANFTGTVAAGNLAAANGCNNDWSTWWVGSRTQWNVTSDFYMGVDVMYLNMTGGSLAGGVTTATQNGVVLNNLVDTTTNGWEVTFRVHKDFYP